MRRAVKRKKNTHGFNLIEAAIALGIVGLVLGGLWIAYGSAYVSMNVNKTLDLAGQIVTGVRNFYGKRHYIPSADTAEFYNMILASGGIPETMLKNGSTEAFFTWGGKATLERESDDVFNINITLMPRSICPRFIIQTAERHKNIGLLSITTGGGAHQPFVQPPKGAYKQVNIDSATEACEALRNSVSLSYSVD